MASRRDSGDGEAAATGGRRSRRTGSSSGGLAPARRGLLRKSNVSEVNQVQATTFKGWINLQLKKRQPPAHIDDIFEDLKTGVNLLYLLEVLSGERLPRERGDSELSHLANCNKVISFLDRHQALKASVNATSIVQGSRILTLGLVWQILLRYQIVGLDMQHSHDSSKLLLGWVQTSLEREGSGVSVSTFTSPAFYNGMAFNAVLASHKPALVNMAEIKEMEPVERLTRLFDTAQEHLDVAPLLSADDVAKERADDKSIMVYTAELYNVLPHFDEPQDIGSLLEKVEELHQQLMAAEKTTKDVVLSSELHELKIQFDSHQKFMTDELGSAQAKRVGDLKTKIPEVVGKLPKGDPNKKKAQKGVVGLVTCWNSVNVEAKKLQSEMLTRLASVQDARLKTVETWLEHLEEEQAKDATLRPEVLTQREQELGDYQKLLDEVVNVDTSAQGKAAMEERLAAINHRWEIVNRFVLLRILQHFRDRMQHAAEDPGVQVEELESVIDAFPSHDAQLQSLQKGVSNLKEAEVGSRHDPYLEKVDEELTVISDQWPGLEDAVQQRLKDMNHDEDMAKQWRGKAPGVIAFLDDADNDLLRQPLPVHDLDAVTDMRKKHQDYLKDMDQQLVNVKDLDRDLKNPDLKKEVDGLYGEVDSRWTKSKDLAQNREETLGKSQAQLEQFESQVEDIASFLNEIEPLFLKPFDTLPRAEQIALLGKLKDAKEKFNDRKPVMADIQATSADLVHRAREASFDPSDLEAEVQTLVERWEDTEVLLDQRLSCHELGFADWVAELEAKRRGIRTAPSLLSATEIVEGVDEEIQRSAYQFPELHGERQHLGDTTHPVERFHVVDDSNDADKGNVDNVKDLDSKLTEFQSMVGTLRTDLDGVKESKSVDSGDSAKQLLQRLEAINTVRCKLADSKVSLGQQATDIGATSSTELGTAVETHTEKALKMYADLEDDCASEKTRLELLNDFLEELAVQEGWLDVAEKTYPAEKSGKAKDAEALSHELDEHSPAFDRLAGLLPNAKSSLDEKTAAALGDQYSTAAERFANLSVGAGIVSPELAAFIADCEKEVEKMNNMEAQYIVDPEDRAKIRPATKLIVAIETAEKEELPPLESECGELAVRRDQLLESLKEGEKPQAEEAYALVENKLQSLKPSLEHRRNELKPYAEVEREASHVEDKIVLARGSIHVLMCQVEGKEDGINAKLGELQPCVKPVGIYLQTAAHLKESSHNSTRAADLHQRMEKARDDLEELLGLLFEQQEVCFQENIKDLVDRCAALLAESDDLMARLKAERPVATDISVLQDQFTSLAELQKSADKAQADGAEVTALVRVQSEKVQQEMKDRLEELNVKLTALFDAIVQRETALETQMEHAQRYNDELTGHVAYLESTQGVLEVVSVADLSTVDQFAAVQKTLEDKAQELAVKRVEIDTLDENVQKLMEVSLDEDCTETKSGLLELHQLFDAVIELLKNRIMAARDAAGLGPLNLEELLAELADLNEWLKAVEKWLIGQENESENFSDPTKAEQQRQKYEAVKEDLTAKQPALEQVTRDVALLLALEPPSPELMDLEEERKSVSDYYDRVWSMVDKLQRLLEKAMPQQMIGMGEWLARVNDWLRAQNPGMAIANGHDDSLGMLEDLRKCEMDLTDRSPIMSGIMTTCKSRLNDPEMTDDARDTLKKQMEKLQQNFDGTIATVQMKQAWLQYYDHRGLKTKEGLTRHLRWFTEREQNPALFTNPAIDLPVLETQIKDHGAFVASVQAQQADLTALKHLATVLMLQATSASPPTPGSSPLSSPEASDLNERSSTFPPLPSCKLSEAFVQLAARLQNLHQKALTHQHKLDDALQQLHELLAAMEVFCGWIREAEKKIEEPLGERGQMRTLQRQLEICLGIKAELPTQHLQIQQINSNCGEFLDSSTGPDHNSSFMKSLTKLNDDWAELQAKLVTRQADVEERMQGSSLEAIQFASDHAAALEWMILMEEKLSLAVAVNADLPALLDHDRQHAELLKSLPDRQMEVDRLRAVGEKLVASEQLSEEDQASVENQMVSLGSHWNRIMNDSGTKTEALAAALLTVNHVYDELKNFKEFILDAEDTLACADTIGGKNSDELQDLMAAVSERQPAFDELLTGGDDLVTADTEIAASSALKLELYQVESRWKSIKVRLAKWAKQLGLDKDFYKLLADLLDWLAMAEAKVSRPNPPVTDITGITEMLNELNELKDTLENTQRPVLVDAENAQQQLERSARNGGDEEKMQADHAKREVDEVKIRMDALAKNLDIKIMSLHPEPRIIAAPEETVESVFDFSGLLGSAPPSGADDNFSSWLISAERRLGKPSPAYTIPAVSERLTELTALRGEVDGRRGEFQSIMPAGTKWDVSGGVEGDRAKIEADDENALQLSQRYVTVDTSSEQKRRKTAELLSRLKKLEVDVSQVQIWLTNTHPLADMVASGDTVDGLDDRDVAIARKELPQYQMLLATTTVGAELLEADQPDSTDGAGSVDEIVKKLQRLTDEMNDVAEKLMRQRSDKEIRDIALRLGVIDDEYQRLMHWLGDLEVILTQPLPGGVDVDFMAIEVALRSAEEIKTKLEVTNKPERQQFTTNCDDVIQRFGSDNDGHDVVGKRDTLNKKWDDVIALCNRRIGDLRQMQTEVPPPVQVEGMPPPPPMSPNASAKELLDWLNSFDIPRIAVGETASCKMVARYTEAVEKYMTAKSSNYLTATGDNGASDAETRAALEKKWSSTQDSVKSILGLLPTVTEESEEFEAIYLPLLGRLTAAHGVVTGTVQDADKEYCGASVMDKLRQCKEIQDTDWQVEILPVHQSGQQLTKKYEKTATCTTPPLRLKLQQLAALLSTVDSSSQAFRESLVVVIDLWNEVEEGDKQLKPVLQRVDECALLAEDVPSTKSGVDAQLPEVTALMASLTEFQALVDKFKLLYNELCKHYPPLSTEPLHRIIEHSIDAHDARKRTVDTRLKELDLARFWHEKILDRLKGILLWIDEQQKLLGICKKLATFAGVVLVVPDDQQPKPLESIKQQEQPVENAINSADLFLKLGRQDDPVLTRPAGLDDKHLSTIEKHIGEAHVTWPNLKRDGRSWDDAMHRARRLFGDFKPAMDRFGNELSEAEDELSQQSEPFRNRKKLEEQLQWHESFATRLTELQALCDYMDKHHQPLPADHIDFADDLQKHYDDLHDRLKAFRASYDERGRALSEAMAGLPSTGDWNPGTQLPGSWVRTENPKNVPFYFDTEQYIAQWEHPVLHDWRLGLSVHNYVHFASYRAALKLRELRRKTSLNTVSFKIVQDVILERGLEQQNDTYISVLSAGNTLSLLYKKLEEEGHDKIDNDAATDILLSLLFSIYDTNRCGQIRAMSLKLFLLTLCYGPAVEKYKWLASQQTDGLGFLDRRTVANILYDANMITKFVFESGHFGNAIVEKAVEECFQQTPRHTHAMRPADFAKWLSLNPQVLHWLWALEKLAKSEQVDHEVTCAICSRNIRGLRYRCKKHTSDNICQDCFWEGRSNDQHKLYHTVQEYTSTAKVGERVRDVTQSLFRHKFRSSTNRDGTEEIKEFNVMQFLADSDHVDRPMMLTEAFVELNPAASVPQRSSSPARFPSDSPVSPAKKPAQTPSKKSASAEAAMLANLDEDARHLQMLIDHRHKLTDSLPAVAAVVPNSSRLQKLMAEQLKEEIAVLEHHHAKAVSQLESVRSKGSGYRPGKRDFPDSPTPERDTNSPALEHPIFDMLDVFATEVTGALTTTPKHVSVPMPEGFNELCNGLQETSHALSGIVRISSTASTVNSSGSDVPLDTSKPSRYYVSECGSGKSADNPQRVQVSRDPPRNPWMSKFSFLAYSERRAGTQRIYVLQAENPLRFRLSLRNQFGRWKDVFSFYAFGSPEPGRVPIFVSTRGTDESLTDPLCFLLSSNQSDRNALLSNGWIASFTFYALAENTTIMPPMNGHVNGDSAMSPT